MATREDRGPSRSRDRADILVSSVSIFILYLVALPVLVGNNRAHVGGVGCELVITYQETGLLRLPVPVQEGSPQMRRRSKQFDPFPPGWGPGGGASNFGPLPPWVGTRRRSKQF